MARTVLIVDDHAPFRALARSLLQLEGFEVVGEAADAMSALDAVGRLQPSVVVLDIQLPDLDGFEVARRLALAWDPPAIMLVSNRDSSANRRQLAGSPAHGFIRRASSQAPHSPRWSAERCAGACSASWRGPGAGTEAESVTYLPEDPGLAAAEATVVLAFIGLGAIAWQRRPSSRSGLLMLSGRIRLSTLEVLSRVKTLTRTTACAPSGSLREDREHVAHGIDRAFPSHSYAIGSRG